MRLRLKSNIGKLYLSNFLTGSIFWYGVEKLFQTSIGMDAVAISIASITFTTILLLFDVPSGLLADRWSRKYCLVLAIALLSVDCVLLGLSTQPIHYILAGTLYGFYVVLTSGTFQAIIYDSVHELGREKEYSKIWGRSYSLFLIGILCSSVVGGAIGEHFNLRAAYFVTIVPCLLNIGVLLSIKEPVFHKEITDTRFVTHAKIALKAITSQRLVLDLGLLLMFVALVSSFQNEYGQLYFIALAFSPVFIGALNSAFAGAGAVGHLLAPKVRLSSRVIAISFAGFFLGYAFWHSRLGLPLFFLSVVARNLLENRSQTEIQDHIGSSIRATTISLINFAANVIYIPMALLFGWIAREYDIFRAYQMVAVATAVLLIVWLIRTRPLAHPSDASL